MEGRRREKAGTKGKQFKNFNGGIGLSNNQTLLASWYITKGTYHHLWNVLTKKEINLNLNETSDPLLKEIWDYNAS